MTTSRSTEFTASEGRRFALPVGAAFLLLAGFLLWRERGGLASGVGAVGGVLILAGLLIPALLGPVYRAWMGLALAISKVTTPIVITVMYYGVITPTGVVMRMLGRNPLKRAAIDDSYWVQRRDGATSGDLRRQF